MEQSSEYQEITYHPEHGSTDDFKKKVKRTTIILSVITLIELGLGLTIYAMNLSHSHFVVLLIKGIIVILTLAKAFYIVAVFMHLGDEIRNMIMTIVVPLMLFIWFIAAFLWDGSSWKNYRNTFDPSFKERTTVQPVTSDTTTIIKPTTRD
ncbi:MAG: cytochrome C oxidase subunit IV family protein [Chitinophagaceae bacterium]|jgi:cytochrome c oxidase subunit IV|nr:cytochrome C oxidase subunit IV family protein [Chitinophagaceae bacterium]